MFLPGPQTSFKSPFHSQQPETMDQQSFSSQQSERW
jgi:hypothetical protein